MKTIVTLLPLLLFAGCTAKSADVPRVATEEVTYSSGHEEVSGYLCRPAGRERSPGLVVIHGDRGLDAWTKRQARRLASLGYVVLAVDLYRGQLPGDLLDAHIMDRGLPEDQVLRDLKAAVSFLAERPDVRGDALGVVGWDMGGGYALDAAIHDPRLKAAVTCYGRLTTDPQWLRPLQATVLGIFAGKDEGIPPETIQQFRNAMRKAGKGRAGTTVYPDAGHGFLNPNLSGPNPANEAARRDAWRQIEAFLATQLKP
jgi:carboxymethylenebutenolidase